MGEYMNLTKAGRWLQRVISEFRQMTNKREPIPISPSATTKPKMSENQREFQNLIFNAKEILESEFPHKIYEYIYLLGKARQHQLITNCLRKSVIEKSSIDDVEDLFFWSRADIDYSFHLYDEADRRLNWFTDEEYIGLSEMRLDPKDTLIFPLTWKSRKLRDCMLEIGRDIGQPWEFDDMNHNVKYVKPLNIGVVMNGNHSMAINIIRNESSDVKVESILDLSPIYEELYTDGEYFWKKQSGEMKERKLAEVDSIEMAALFEIGRLINEYHPLTNLHGKGRLMNK
ncbi:hypothetical protein H0266_18450 [Halobacillus locisalis]|uniref:Uncharacterized protein n=1 Tax=Halobacillus locisalis TaxID=220753 RepID=A0A838CY61_9BACI|nr:DUF6710 family protein [Halobacillus locisalis]MBA2176864.1 hypothetical protein [Halobacillus locisalis]